MKLLYVCSDFGISASGTKGASEHLRGFMRGMVSCGHEVRFLSPKPGGEDLDGVQRVLPAGRDPVDKTVKSLKRWLINSGFDDALPRDLRTLMYNTWVPNQVLKMSQTDPPDALIERYSLFSHLGIDLADKWDVPYILEVNALLTEEASEYRTLCLPDLASQIERRAFMRADAIVTVSTTLAERIVDRGVPAERVHVVPNGADPDFFQYKDDREQQRQELGFSPDDFVIGFSGSLKAWHGVTTLIDAFIRLHTNYPGARLLIVGKGPTEAEVRQQVQRAGLTSEVVFTGAVPHDQMPGMLAAMDIGTAPYVHENNFYFSPLKVFEYMAAGLCVVAPRLGQLNELIEHEVNGLLYKPGSTAEFVKALEMAYTSTDLRCGLGKNARQTILDQYTWRHAAQSVLRLIDSQIKIREKEDSNIQRRGVSA